MPDEPIPPIASTTPPAAPYSIQGTPPHLGGTLTQAAPPPAAPPPPAPPAAAPPSPPPPEDDDDDEEAPPPPAGKSPNDMRAADLRIRERKLALREAFGTSDPEKIRAIKEKRAADEEALRQRDEELARYRQAEEERKRASMSEVEQLRADLAAKDTEIADLKAKLSKQQEEVRTAKQMATVGELVQRNRVKPECVEFFQWSLGRYYESLNRANQIAFGRNKLAIDRWARDFCAKHPEIVITQATTLPSDKEPETTAATPPAAKPVVRRPLGATPPQRTQPGAKPTPPRRATSGNPSGKSVMDMNPKELDAHYKSLGYANGKPYG